MNTSRLLHRLSLAAALTLPAASLVAFAAEPVETTDIEVVADGRSEKVSIAGLKPGETRQLYSEAGTLVTATRTAETLELDIGGDKTSIRMREPALDDVELAALIEAHGDGHAHAAGHAGADAKRIVHIRHADAHAAGAAAAKAGEPRVMVFHHGADGEHDGMTDAELDLLLEQAGDDAGDGKRVIVKRRLAKSDGADAK